MFSIDGVLTLKLGIAFGYREVKDVNDHTDKEIANFSDDVTAVTVRDGHEQIRAATASPITEPVKAFDWSSGN